MAQIKNFLQNAKVYLEGNTLVGVADVELPDVAYMTEKVKSLGISGELEIPVLGHFKEMKTKLKFATATKDFGKLMTPESKLIQVYASLQAYDPSSNAYKSIGYKATMNVLPLSNKAGKVDIGKPMDSEIEFAVSAFKLEVDGQKIYDIDVLNLKCEINGQDQLSEVRTNLGM